MFANSNSNVYESNFFNKFFSLHKPTRTTKSVPPSSSRTVYKKWTKKVATKRPSKKRAKVKSLLRKTYSSTRPNTTGMTLTTRESRPSTRPTYANNSRAKNLPTCSSIAARKRMAHRKVWHSIKPVCLTGSKPSVMQRTLS